MRFFGALDRILVRVYVACGYAAALSMIVLAGLILTSIISRLVGVYVPGVNTFSGYAMAAASYLALAYTFREKGHIRVGLLLTKLHGRRRWLAEIWCLGLASLFSGYLAFYLVKMTYVSWIFGDRSEGADATPLWIPQSAMAFGAVILAVAIVHALIRASSSGRVDEESAG